MRPSWPLCRGDSPVGETAWGVQTGTPESPQEEAMTKPRRANKEELGGSGHHPHDEGYSPGDSWQALV